MKKTQFAAATRFATHQNPAPPILYITMLLLALFSLFVGQAQELKTSRDTLKIGDTLPSAVWITPIQVINNPNGNTLTLDKYKDNLILLDFWGKWCTACIGNFPRMDSLQHQFGDKLKILAVSRDDRKTLSEFFHSESGRRYQSTLSTVGDTVFNVLFPHFVVPYIVWLYKGKLFNTTDGPQVTAENISKVLSGDTSSLQQVVTMTRDRPLFLSTLFDLQKDLVLSNYFILTRNKVRGIGSGTEFRRTQEGVVYGRQFTNLSLLEIYKSMAYHLFEQINDSFSPARIIVESVKMRNDPKDSEVFKPYSLELIVPVKKADSLYKIMLANLNAYTPVTAEVTKRSVKTLVLTRTTAGDKHLLSKEKGGALKSVFSPQGRKLQNAPIQIIVNNMSDFAPLPIVDGTGIKQNVDFQFPATTDLPSLKKQLKLYGLDLVEQVRTLNVLVIKDRP